jgi:hypothetical protein
LRFEPRSLVTVQTLPPQDSSDAPSELESASAN